MSILRTNMEHVVHLTEGEIMVAFVKDGHIYHENYPLTKDENKLFDIMRTAIRTQTYIEDPEGYKKKYNIVAL